jgi:NTE family protein
MLDFVKRHLPGDITTEAPPPPSSSPRRLSVGLALGGGAARGFAHIGVLRTLQKHGIEPQVISGTSIGAVVGGLYAAGRLDAFEEWGRSLTRRRVFGYLDFSITGSGLIGGGRLLENLTHEVAGVRIEDLPLKFSTIATEIGTGHEIWLTRGLLTDALAASYALPGLFPPVCIGGRWLMDGALVNPVPVSAARAAGARLVVAINLSGLMVSRGTTIQGTPDRETGDVIAAESTSPRGLRGTAERLLRRKFAGTPNKPGFSTVMIDAFNIMQDRITRARLAGDPPDVTIAPRLDDVGFFDFHHADAAIAAGALATERAIETIIEAAETLV